MVISRRIMNISCMYHTHIISLPHISSMCLHMYAYDNTVSRHRITFSIMHIIIPYYPYHTYITFSIMHISYIYHVYITTWYHVPYHNMIWYHILIQYHDVIPYHVVIRGMCSYQVLTLTWYAKCDIYMIYRDISWYIPWYDISTDKQDKQYRQTRCTLRAALNASVAKARSASGTPAGAMGMNQGGGPPASMGSGRRALLTLLTLPKTLCSRHSHAIS